MRNTDGYALGVDHTLLAKGVARRFICALYEWAGRSVPVLSSTASEHDHDPARSYARHEPYRPEETMLAEARGRTRIKEAVQDTGFGSACDWRAPLARLAWPAFATALSSRRKTASLRAGI